MASASFHPLPIRQSSGDRGNRHDNTPIIPRDVPPFTFLPGIAWVKLPVRRGATAESQAHWKCDERPKQSELAANNERNGMVLAR
jgi:hypothetical protein